MPATANCLVQRAATQGMNFTIRGPSLKNASTLTKLQDPQLHEHECHERDDRNHAPNIASSQEEDMRHSPPRQLPTKEENI